MKFSILSNTVQSLKRHLPVTLSIWTSEFSLIPCRVNKQIWLLQVRFPSLRLPHKDQPGAGVKCGYWSAAC